MRRQGGSHTDATKYINMHTVTHHVKQKAEKQHIQGFSITRMITEKEARTEQKNVLTFVLSRHTVPKRDPEA